jgi:hypothetical protein
MNTLRPEMENVDLHTCHEIFSFCGHVKPGKKIKLFSVHTSTEHSPSFASEKDISLQLSAI